MQRVKLTAGNHNFNVGSVAYTHLCSSISFEGRNAAINCSTIAEEANKIPDFCFDIAVRLDEKV